MEIARESELFRNFHSTSFQVLRLSSPTSSRNYVLLSPRAFVSVRYLATIYIYIVVGFERFQRFLENVSRGFVSIFVQLEMACDERIRDIGVNETNVTFRRRRRRCCCSEIEIFHSFFSSRV